MRFDISGLDDVIKQMTDMEQRTGKVADAMVAAGAGKVREAWQHSAQKHGHVRTGAMIGSIKEKFKKGDVPTAEIYPQGKDSKGVRNAEKAFILHYGTSKIQGSHWVDDADQEAEETAIQAMTEIWDQFVATGKEP
jgi:HK97 gp10 family phage protein